LPKSVTPISASWFISSGVGLFFGAIITCILPQALRFVNLLDG
jgi:hypothetical protein